MPNALSKAIMKPKDGSHLKISPKLEIALRAVIHDGATLEAAAKLAGLSTFLVRQSFEHAHVLRFIRNEKQVRLESLRLETLNDLARIKGGNGAAAVSAIAMLEEMAAPAAQSAATIAATTPGVTINIINALPTNSGRADEQQLVQGVTIDADPPQSLDHPAISPESSNRPSRG
jgi:hypothetical protein